VARLDRRAVLAGLGVMLLGESRPASAQPPRSLPRIVLHSFTDWTEPLKAGLRDLGWVDSQNMVFEWRRGSGNDADPSAYRDDLAGLSADILVVAGPHRLRAAMTLTSTIPIIGIDLESDPVERGFVRSLARPGGNVSGIWLDLPEIAGKQLQFLGEVLPGLRRVGIVWDDRIGKPQLAGAQVAARAAGMTLHPVSIHRIADVEETMKRVLDARPQALLALTAPVVFSVQERMAELSVRYRVPSISPFSTYPDRGGLLAYGPDFVAIWRQTARYADRILKGARIGDLPVERPSTFHLIVNLRTARALGVNIPQSVLARADRVVE
jgi:putative ABC transport system substrate-binding protein